MSVPAMQPALPRLSLFQIEAELLQFVEAREDARERLETAAPSEAQDILREISTLEILIQEYVRAEVRKVDNIAGIIREFQARGEIHAKEAARLAALAVREEETVERIKAMVLAIMEEFGEPKLQGRIFRLAAQGNGGIQALTIAQIDLVSDDYKQVELSIPLTAWKAITEREPGLASLARVRSTEPSNERIRATLERGEGVAGCRLEPRGKHLRIK